MDVTWRIEARGSGCLVDRSSTSSDRGLPGLAEFVDRFFTRPIAGRTLATFKALAEALAEGDGDSPAARPESDRPPPANQHL